MDNYFKERREAEGRLAGEFKSDRKNPTTLDSPLLPYEGKPKQFGFLEEGLYSNTPTNFGVGRGNPQQFQTPSRGRPSVRANNDKKDIQNPYRVGRPNRKIRTDRYEGW